MSQKSGNKEKEETIPRQPNGPEKPGFPDAFKELMGRRKREKPAPMSTPIPAMSKQVWTCSKCSRELKSEKEHKSHVDENFCDEQPRMTARSRSRSVSTQGVKKRKWNKKRKSNKPTTH